MTQLHQAFTIFLSLFVEALPFLTLGVILSSVLLVFSDDKKLIQALPRHPFLGALAGSLMGFLFPVCECGNVPVARRFLIQGLPTSVAVAFLLSAPTLNPIVIWSTWVAFRDQPSLVVARVVCSLLITLVISCLFSLQKDPQPLLNPLLLKRVAVPRQALSAPLASSAAASPLLQSGTFLLGQPGQPLRLDESLLLPPQAPQRWQLFCDNVVQELRELGGMLIIGSLIAAGIQGFVPREYVLLLGQGTLTSILAMMMLAAIVSVCSTVDSFFALSFATTFTSSSLLAFLVFGPMIDIKSISLMLSIFQGRILVYLLVLAAQLTFLLSLAYSYLF
ncbi:permease [Synechocystis sp. LKSZ1]|uniref:permease n=1 Tax=Synechocystis sp. LKSZ1 TaxID=3144951 RepID=UPI00336C0DB1